MEKAKTPRSQLITISYFKSQRGRNNTDVTRITICCHVDYMSYLIESCHNGFNVMYMHMSIFLLSGLLQFAVSKLFTFC